MKLAAYRLVQQRHISSAFDGEGARLYGGRWNSSGVSMVYTSESLALCCLEVFVHLPSYDLLQDYVFVKILFDSSLVTEAELADGWNERPVSKVSQAIGDQWIKDSSSPILKVPSVIIPIGVNYLLNIAHPDFEKVTIGEPTPMTIDPRLQKL